MASGIVRLVTDLFCLDHVPSGSLVACFQRRHDSEEPKSKVTKKASEAFSAALSNHSHITEVVQRSLCWSAGGKKVKMSVMALPRSRSVMFGGMLTLRATVYGFILEEKEFTCSCCQLSMYSKIWN